MAIRVTFQTDGGASELLAVPSVHFRLAFAADVRASCGDRKTGPDAIAVELGPRTAAAARAWLKELGVGPGRKTPLPCMFGLLKHNRLLHPAAKARLARMTGPEGQAVLERMTPQEWQEHYGFLGARIFFLSPVDSIVEAIRCSLELDLPLYGVDLEETAAAQRTPSRVQDPLLAGLDASRYAAANADYAEDGKDEWVDGRREIAAAARLKTLLARHPRVLYVGGLAHWNAIRKLLDDAALAAAAPSFIPPPEAEFPEIARVVVDPSLAVNHMDIFPFLVRRYENDREPADRPQEVRLANPIGIRAEFEQALYKVYSDYFVGTGEGESPLDRRPADWEAHFDFERLIQNLAAVRLEALPDLFTVVLAAHTTMSPGFARALFEEFIRFDWAKPSQYPDLAVLMSSPAPSHSPIRAELAVPGRARGRLFFIDPEPGGPPYTMRLPFFWEWPWVPPEPSGPFGGATRLTWLPKDDRLSALSFRAAELGVVEGERVRAELFEGSLLDGIHVKRTLREAARGEDKVFVRQSRRRRSKGVGPEANPFPMVWILRPGAGENDQWHSWGYNLDDIVAAARFAWPEDVAAAERLERLRIYGGRECLRLARGASGGDVPEATAAAGVTRYDIHGFVLFGPNLFRRQEQDAAWLLRTTDWSRDPPRPRIPFHSGGLDIPDLFRQLKERHGVDMGSPDWIGAMVRAAVAFAESAVTVVVPDAFELPAHARAAAARAGIDLRVLPHSLFPLGGLTDMAETVFVPGSFTSEGVRYPESVARVLDEAAESAAKLIPRRWLDFGLGRKDGATG